MEIDYTKETYEEIKNELINKIATYLPDWTDYTATDPGMALLKLFSALGESLSYRINLNLDESFLSTATEKSSVYNMALMLGYPLRGTTAAVCNIVFTLTGVQALDYTISKGTRVESYDGEVIFETIIDLVIPAGALGNERAALGGATPETGDYLYSVEARNWTKKEEEVIGSIEPRADSTKDFLRFEMPARDIIRDTVSVDVKEYDVWVNYPVQTTLSFSISTDKHSYFEFDEERYGYIIFGNDEMGMIPQEGIDNVRVTYAYGGGVAGNGYEIGQINQLRSAIPYVAEVTNINITTGGKDEETITEIKNLLPKSWAKMFRVVTTDDYRVAALEFGVGKAMAIYEGTKVSVYVLDTSGEYVSDIVKNQLDAYLEARSFPGVYHILRDPYKVSVDAIISVTPLSGYSSDAVNIVVAAALSDEVFAIASNDLGDPIRLGNVYEIIEAVTGVDYTTITKFTRRVYARPVYGNTGDLVWTFDVKTTVTDKLWIVTMLTANTYYVTDGTTVYNGTVGVDLEISGEITISTQLGTVDCIAGDKFYIRTSGWNEDIEADDIEILVEGTIAIS